MGEVIIFLIFTIYFAYMSLKTFKIVKNSYTEREVHLFLATFAFTFSLFVCVENLGAFFESLVKLFGGA